MARRVLVTRPEPGAARTAKRLAALGFEPVLLPLTHTIALPVAVDCVVLPGAGRPPPLTPLHKGEGNTGTPIFPKIAGADRRDTPAESPSPLWGGVRDGGTALVVAVTSANAIRHAPPELLAALAHLPCHAVGEKTAQAARGAGFSAVRAGPGNAETLAGEIAASLAGQGLVYPCGRVRFAGFEQRLRAAGVRVFPIETYDTVALPYDDEAVATCLDGRPVDAVLLYSARAAGAMAAFARRPALVPLLGNATFACLSSRVAGALATVAGDRIRVSREPNEEALFRLLSP
ncbi:MAG: uroporphyrinogen-III synthase [Mesorhizobium sp.]